MSKGRTIKRNPIQLDANDYELNEQYFNFASFGGINSNKNFIGVNQYSFEDANNVYVDQDNQLHTRPPIKTMTIEAFPVGWTPIDIVKVNNVTFYKLKNGSQYQYWFYYHNDWRNIQSTEKSLVTYVNDYFVVFLETEIYLIGWNYDENEIVKLQASNNDTVIYTPVTKIVQGSSIEKAESPNLLTTSEITRYIFEHELDDVTSVDDIVDKTLTLDIGGEKYTITFQQGNQIVFSTPLTTHEIPLDDYGSSYPPGRYIHRSTNGKILVDYEGDNGFVFYLTADGLVYFTYSFPKDLIISDEQYCITISEDGTRIWCWAVNSYGRQSDNYTSTNMLYNLFTKVYYCDVNGISISGWTSVEVPYGQMSLAGRGGQYCEEQQYNMVQALTGTSSDTMGYSCNYNGSKTVQGVPVIHSPEAGHCVIAFIEELDGDYYHKANQGNYDITGGHTNGTIYSLSFIRIDSNTNGFETHYCQSLIQLSSTNDNDELIANLNWENAAIPDPNTNLGFVRYCITNSQFAVVVGCRVIRFYNNNNKISVSYENDILYHIVDSNGDDVCCIENIPLWYNEPEINYSELYFAILQCHFKAMYRYEVTDAPYNDEHIDDRNFNFTQNWFYSALYQNGSIFVKSVYNTLSPARTYIDKITATITNNNQSGWADARNNKITYVSNLFSYLYIRYNLPNLISNQYEYYNSESGNASDIDSTIIAQSDLGNIYISDDGQNVLSDKWYYYNDTIYPLLSNNNDDAFYPFWLSADGTEFIYYNKRNFTLYTNQYEGQITTDIVIKGKANYVVPNFAEDFITTTIAINNLIYQSENRSIEATGDVPAHLQLYFPVDSKVAFVDKITNLIVFSQTSLGVFLEDIVYEYQYNTDNDVYTLTPTKLQLGCIDGADILIGYDGSTIFMTQLKGLAGLNYQDFVQSTEQVYTYLTEAIMDLYDRFKGDRKIKLYQYKDWLFMYKQDNQMLYVFDTRSSTWWKWTLPYAPQKILYDGNNLLLLLNNQIAIFDFVNKKIPYYDFIGNTIHWSFRSQKLHFNAPNNYKHIRQLNVITTQSGHELRYKLKFINYRNLNNLAETDTVDFEIDQLTTLIKRVTFMKTNAFQFEISDDTTDDKPKYFETPDIAIKYRITERVR